MVAALAQWDSGRSGVGESGWPRLRAWLSLGHWLTDYLTAPGLSVALDWRASWLWQCLLWRSREDRTWFYPLDQKWSASVPFPHPGGL